MQFLKSTHSILFLLSLISSLTFGQATLKGTVSDEQHTVLPFTNVVLYNSTDSSLVKGIITDLQGNYSILGITPGSYYVEVSMIGYINFSEAVSITANDFSERHIDFSLREEINQLDEVVVRSEKALYEKSSDRIVVNVQSSTTAKGKSVLQVLAKSPGVLVNQQSGNISLYGKSGVLVMINGKMMRLPPDAVIQLLDGMSAANVEKIELITHPPAGFDAEGNAGIINIKTLQQDELGTSGSASATLGYNQAETWGGNLTLNHRGKGYNLFADYSRLTDRNKQSWLDNRKIFGSPFDQTVKSVQQREPTTTSQNLRAGAEWNLTSSTSLNLVVTGSHRNWDMDGLTETDQHLKPDSSIHTQMKLHESNIWKSGSASIGFNHQFDSAQSISVNMDVMNYKNDNPSTYDVTQTIQNLQSTNSRIEVSKETPIRFKIASIDYQNQIKKNMKFVLGAKGTISDFENVVEVKEGSGELLVNKEFSNTSNLHEKIWAGYMGLSLQLAASTDLQAGLRYEYTDSNLGTLENENLIDRQYGNLFPSLTVTKKLGTENVFNLAYSRRITRPTFNEMAPFVFFTGPNTFFEGNPTLRPAITDALEVSLQKGALWLSAKYSYTKNQIGALQPVLNKETGVQVYKSLNMDYVNLAAFSTSYSIGIKKWWDIQTEATLYLQNFQTSYTNTEYTKSDVYLSLSATSTITLPRHFSLEISGNYQSKQYWGIWEFAPMGQLDIGFKKKLGSGTLSLVFSDILHTYIWNSDIILPDKKSSANWKYDWNARAIGLTYSVNFGNNKVKAATIKSVSDEERKRVN